MLRDRFRIRQELGRIKADVRKGKEVDNRLAQISTTIAKSSQCRQTRENELPKVEIDTDLPIFERREEIIATMKSHQVVVISGETGSGKSTQLPLMALQAGFGISGLIGHTQPRRIAARSVASRIAEELNVPLGQHVGYKIRFAERLGAGLRVTGIAGRAFATIFQRVVLEQPGAEVIAA